MRIALGSDHAGYKLKERIKEILEKHKIDYTDLGTDTDTEQADYPDYARAVAIGVAEGKYSRGILSCRTGIGMSIVANKIKGIRAALCYDIRTAELSRSHNNSNILCLGSSLINDPNLENIVITWLNTPFLGGRHSNRIEKIKLIEEETMHNPKN